MNLPVETWMILSAPLLLGLLLGWLFGRLQIGRKLQAERETLLQQLAGINAELTAERKATGEKLMLLEENRQQTEQAFRALSAEALATNNQTFLDLAKTTNF